jgi:HEAT repeat protein
MPAEIRRHVLRLYDPDDNECARAVMALAAMGPAAAPAAPFLAAILHDEVRHGSTSARAVDALISIGKPTIEPVLIMLQFGGAYARMRGLRVLSALKDDRGIQALVTMVADNTGASGHSALDALRDHGQPALDYLTKGLSSDNPIARRNCACAMPAFPTTNTIALLNTALTDGDPTLRAAASQAMLTAMQRNPDLKIPATREVLASMNDPDPSIRRNSIRMLLSGANEDRRRHIASMAGDQDAGVQMEVIHALSSFGDTNAEPTIVSLVKAPDKGVSAAAIDALSGRGGAAVMPMLTELLASPDAAVREGAVAKVGALQATNSVDILLPMVRDRDPLVRTTAVRMLGQVRDRRVLESLREAARDSDPGVRLETVRALSAYYLGDAEVGHNIQRRLPPTREIPLYAPEVRETLVGVLHDTEPRIRETAFNTLTRRGPPLLPTNVLVAVLSDRLPHMRTDALNQLLMHTELPALDPVRSCLRDNERSVRASAIRVLCRFRDRPSMDAIVSALASGGEEAHAAAGGLGAFGEDAIPALAAALRHEDSAVRSTAASSLSAMRNPKAAEALRKAADDGSPGTRRAATESLRREGSLRETPELLVRRLKEDISGDTRGVRDELARAGARAIPALLPLLRESNTAVRTTAAGILSQIADHSVVLPLTGLLGDPDPAVRATAIECLAGTVATNAAAQAIRRMLSDRDPQVREAAAGALGRMQDRASVQPLSSAMRDENWHVRATAAESLGRMPCPESVDALVAAVADAQWPVRRAAASSLGHIRDSRSIPALTQALGDPHWSVRQSAASSLKAISGQAPDGDTGSRRKTGGG